MKHRILAALLSSIACMPFSAHAMLKVTNLSYTPQTVEFITAGTPLVKTIAPRSAEFFPGADGLLSLKTTAPQPASASSTVAADGILSGIIGAARTSNIPASQMDTFVIWPDGRLLLQGRKKVWGGGRR